MKANDNKSIYKMISIYLFLIILYNCVACVRMQQYSGGGNSGGQQNNGQHNNDENCETLSSEIHLIKEEYDELGRLQRTCNGEVSVNKCEGMCSSQVQPSVITATGFLKECYCCRESFLRDRLVTLTHCYDPDGGRLNNADMATMDIRLKEPADCRCFKCGDFSR